METKCIFPGGDGRGVKLKTQLHLVLRLRMSEAIPLLHVLAFMVSTGATLPYKWL
jgi:hypothetical protein